MEESVLSKLRDGKPKPGGGKMYSCPVPGHAHHDRNRSLSADIINGKLLLYCFAGHTYEQIVSALDGGVAPFDILKKSTTKVLDPAERTALALRLSQESRRADGTLVEKYLRSRRITIALPVTLRFHSSLRHPGGSYLPAMIALVQDVAGKPIAIHRTYLNPHGGKANVEPSKLALGPCRSGAVWLGGRDIPTKVAISEGIETALSVMQATGICALATLGTELMKAVIVPPEVKEVVIAADGDEPGEQAARKLATRLVSEGRTVKIARPPKGQDFNDVLMRGRADGKRN